MRYFMGLVCVLAALAFLPLSVSAQVNEEGTEPNLQESAPSPEPAPQEPALQLGLDDDSVKLAPSPPRTADGYTLEETQLRVKRAKIGLWSTAGATVVGGVMMGASWTCMGAYPSEEACPGPVIAGAVVVFSGAVGMIVTGALLGARKRKLRSLQEADYGRPHRVQWDLARSQVVF